MGLSAELSWVDGTWYVTEDNAMDVPDIAPKGNATLSLNILDSDVAMITWTDKSLTDWGGPLILGGSAESYMGDLDDIVPAGALGSYLSWVAQHSPQAHDAAAIREIADPPGKDSEDIFVEDTVARLLLASGIPRPALF